MNFLVQQSFAHCLNITTPADINGTATLQHAVLTEQDAWLASMEEPETRPANGFIAGTWGNPVAKNMEKFNKPRTHRDRKRATKRGERKHKHPFA